MNDTNLLDQVRISKTRHSAQWLKITALLFGVCILCCAAMTMRMHYGLKTLERHNKQQLQTATQSDEHTQNANDLHQTTIQLAQKISKKRNKAFWPVFILNVLQNALQQQESLVSFTYDRHTCALSFVLNDASRVNQILQILLKIPQLNKVCTQSLQVNENHQVLVQFATHSSAHKNVRRS